MSEKDIGNLYAILDSCDKIESFTADIWDADAFFADDKTFDAVLMNFVVIGESVTRLSLTFKETNDQIPWIKIRDFRNIVAHDYFGVDAEEVWQVIKNDLLELKEELRQILEKK